jgi:hypothetical protein
MAAESSNESPPGSISSFAADGNFFGENRTVVEELPPVFTVPAYHLESREVVTPKLLPQFPLTHLANAVIRLDKVVAVLLQRPNRSRDK